MPSSPVSTRELPVPSAALADDILPGGGEIAVFLYGDDSKANRKKVFHAAAQGALPVFRIGRTICARKSAIIAWIEAQERKGRSTIAVPLQRHRRGSGR